MAKLGSEKKPAIVRVQTEERAQEIAQLCEQHGWKFIVGIEPDKPEDITDLKKLQWQQRSAATTPPSAAGAVPGNNYCPCGSGKKYKKCCGLTGAATTPGTPPAPAGDLSSGTDRHTTSTAAKAQQLFYEAVKERSPKKQLLGINQVLQLDPEHIDALAFKAELTLVGEAYLRELRRIVALGERQLKAQKLDRQQGQYWLIHETRPYMRARRLLAEELWVEGHAQEAIAEYRALLKLNPNDNQGNRDSLLAAYLSLGDCTGARLLLQQYANDGSAVFAWGLVLLEVLAGNEAAAEKALTQARANNRYVEQYLLGDKSLPAQLPSNCGPGEVGEALVCCDMLLEAWGRHDAPLAWLHAHRDTGKTKIRGKARAGTDASFCYDPLQAPDAKQWLALDETERYNLVEKYHRRAKVRIEGAQLHYVVHAVVETQALMVDETPVAAALTRLVGEGLDRHEAVHAVGSVLALHLEAVVSGIGNTDIEHYYRQIRELTASRWQELWQ